MWRTVLSVIGGLIAWMLVVALIDLGLRHGLQGYAEAETSLAFTLTMKIARLSMAMLASIAAGIAVRAIAPASRLAPWIVGFLLLLLFVPIHVQLWSKLPAWYHLTFLITLAPLIALGAQLRTRGKAGGQAHA